MCKVPGITGLPIISWTILKESEAMFQNVVDGVRSQYDPLKVAEGRFGAMMDVEIHNDGPVTIILESPSKEEPAGPAAKAKKEHEAAKAARREQFAGKSSKPDVVDPRAAADADK